MFPESEIKQAHFQKNGDPQTYRTSHSNYSAVQYSALYFQRKQSNYSSFKARTRQFRNVFLLLIINPVIRTLFNLFKMYQNWVTWSLQFRNAMVCLIGGFPFIYIIVYLYLFAHCTAQYCLQIDLNNDWQLIMSFKNIFWTCTK